MPPSSNFYEIAVTYDSAATAARFYMDGNFTTNIYAAPLATNASIENVSMFNYYGSDYRDASSFMPGYLDYLYVFDRVLSDTEIELVFDDMGSLRAPIFLEHDVDLDTQVLEILTGTDTRGAYVTFYLE